MTKTEFLETLEQKLMSEVDAETVRRNLRYYNGYIEAAIQNGKTEQAVLEELGSPLLIARTIIDTQSGSSYDGAYEKNNDTSGRDKRRAFHGRTSGHESDEGYHSFHVSADDKKAKVFLILAIFGILILLFTVLRILLPILLPIFLVLFVVNLIKKR